MSIVSVYRMCNGMLLTCVFPSLLCFACGYTYVRNKRL